LAGVVLSDDDRRRFLRELFEESYIRITVRESEALLESRMFSRRSLRNVALA
jgi:hypothetical protein